MSQPKNPKQHNVNYVSIELHYVKSLFTRNTPTAKELLKIFRSKKLKYSWTNNTVLLRDGSFPFLNLSFSRNYTHVGRFVDGRPTKVSYAIFAPTINELIPKLVEFKIISLEQAKKLIA